MLSLAWNKLTNWIDERYPLSDFMRAHLTEYYAPRNFNFWYLFGIFSLAVFVLQILTGLWLTMNYNPSAEGAFKSVEYIMRDVPFGWLLRYMHSTGASFFFIVIYMHMLRGLLYGSYKKPRELVWLLGMGLFFCLMAEAFFGYLLPWGNMSFWGAQVITSLFGAIPIVGERLIEFIRGDYNVSGVTLNRFFALHVIAVPLAMAGLVFMHVLALHNVGSNNPDGIEIKEHKDEKGIPLDGVAFHPYHTTKDLFALAVFFFIFAIVVFYNPEMGGLFLEAPNFEAADPMKTPEHIAPVWYMTPYYAILRAIPNKLLGVIAMGLAVFMFALMPWLDNSPVKSIRYKGVLSKIALGFFILSFIVLGYLGLNAPTPGRTIAAQIFTLVYFGYFLLMPFYTKYETCKPVPTRVSNK